MTESEEEAYGLLKRHLERSLDQADVTVLGRNNSADRLEARTPVPAGAPLAGALVHAKPRSCLAVRTAEQQNRTNGEVPLMECEICGKLGPTACQPLLVGGEVMALLPLTDGPMADREREKCGSRSRRRRRSWPTCATSRSPSSARRTTSPDGSAEPAIRQRRGEANGGRGERCRAARRARAGPRPLQADQRRLRPRCRRRGARGGRGDAPCDAAARRLLRSMGRRGVPPCCCRTPTPTAPAPPRSTCARPSGAPVWTVQRDVSASLGVAALPFHALDAQGLVRSADRALYAAKAGGRDRVEVFADLDHGVSSNGASAEADRPKTAV